MFKKKKQEKAVEAVTEKPVKTPVQPTVVTFHKERWDNDSGTNQLRSEKLPSLND
ncbi:MAG: hypothetical protein KDH96_12050 [Candidatus Riesia sp.]|nr:hypothetical protein [Candidatus Riesia sp.]